MQEDKMLSIWFFVSIVLGLYGIIIIAMGLYFLAVPEAQTGELAHLNPSLWWGAIMLAFAAILFTIDRKTR